MIFNRAANDPELSYELAIMLRDMRFADAEGDVHRACQRLKPGVVQVVFEPANDEYPAWAVVSWIDMTLVLLDGVTRLDHAARYAGNMAGGINYNLMSGVNGYLLRWADSVLDFMTPRRIAYRPRVILAGHSLGGAAALPMALRMQLNPAVVDISIVTYGSPRPGPAAFATACDRLDIARWMGFDDPVPAIPPRENQAPLTFSLLSPQTALVWNSYVHTRGGLLLQIDGTTVAADVPAMSDLGLETSLAAWIYSTRDNTQTGHSMISYVDRLLFRKQVFLINARQPEGTRRPGPGGMNMNHSGVIASQTAQQALVIAQAAVTRAAVVTFPKVHLMRALKVGNLWCVEWEKLLVAVGPTRRAASEIARAGNRFLRRLQRAGSVAPQVMKTAAEFYLTAAADPNGSFRPVQNIT